MAARVRKGDRVVVISGEDKGKQGKVVRVLPERDMVVIEGINLVKKHLAATPQRPGGILGCASPEGQSDQSLRIRKRPLERTRALFGQHYSASTRERYWSASATWAGWIASDSPKSAMVRETFRTR